MAKILTCQGMWDMEEAAFQRGVRAEDLMEEAGLGIARSLLRFLPRPGTVVMYLGKGNNAGDALVAARHLHAAGWKVAARFEHDPGEFRELPAKHWREVQAYAKKLAGLSEVQWLEGSVVLLDGLVGIGSKGALRGGLADLAREINTLRNSRQAIVIALDIPSGLHPETGAPQEPCVQADWTFTMAFAKTPLLADAATALVGRLEVITLRELDDATGDPEAKVLAARDLRSILPHRPFDFHKGQVGRVGLIAGSRGFLGAADLASRGALHGGAGLVTLYVKEDIYPLIVVRTPPEVMVKRIADYREVLQDPLQALGLGPGIGHEAAPEIMEICSKAAIPLVIDADGLNILARHGLSQLEKPPAPRLLTPHPGEFARLAEHAPRWKTMSRLDAARDFAASYPQCTLLLKGARTVIAAKEHPAAFNTTGHPGMASGGMGDVLTGVCSALLGQGLSPYEAACVASWVNGRAAELALSSGEDSAESLSATSVIGHLGGAFEEIRDY